MSVMHVDQYQHIMRVCNPIFYASLLVFFLKEFSLLFGWQIFVNYIPDLLFLLLFVAYAIVYIGPIIRPDLIEGYELPTYDQEEIEEEELTAEEKELRDLERISL